jgi:hypothetical protein
VTNGGPGRSGISRTVIALGLVSAGVIALQVGLIRALSVASYHHFVYLVISVALLGFGASGTALSLFRRRAVAGYERWALVCLAVFAVSTAWAYRVAGSLPLDVQYLLQSAGQLGWLSLYLILLVVPFLAGGLFIGLVLTRYAGTVGTLYAVNLVTSGLGGIAGVLLAFAVEPERLPGVIAVFVAAVVPLWAFRAFPGGFTPGRRAAIAIVALLSVGAGIVLPPPAFMDKYKAEAHALRLQSQGDAELVAEHNGPRGRIHVYDAPSMHHTLFASPLAPVPPSQLIVFVDGDISGSVFEISEPEEAPILDAVPQSLPYRLLDRPRVLVLGDTGGFSVWLALRNGARSVTVVQSDPSMEKMLTEDLHDRGGGVFGLPGVTVITASPRLFLEQATDQFDLIHVTAAEGMPASSGGLASLREDYLMTVQAMALALERLAPGGLIAVTRGLQSPPRDNIRILALLAEAITRTGGNPSQRLLQARNYLAATTIAASQPLSAERIAQFHGGTLDLLMDADYFPGVSEIDLTARNILPPNPGSGSHYFQAAQALLGPAAAREEFYQRWVYDVRPPTDNKPYFHSFFRLESLPQYFEAYGEQWFQRLELGLAVVIVTLVQVLLLGLVLIAVPVLLLRRRVHPGTRAGLPAGTEQASGVLWAVMHFSLIGFGFMFLEMLFIQRLTRFLGDPTFATSAVLTAILSFAGAGSLVQTRLRQDPLRRIAVGSTAVALLAVVSVLSLDPLLNLAAAAGPVARYMFSVVLLMPIAFFLGWQFPAGIDELNWRNDRLIPIAWASNGVASVVAAPLAVLVAITGGFRLVAGLAVVCYVAVAALSVVAGRRSGARQNMPIHSPSSESGEPQSDP